MMKLPKCEYIERVRRMQQLLIENNIDAVIIVSSESEPANVRYFTNYSPIFETAGLIIPKEGEQLLLIGPESATLAEKHSVVKEYRALLEFRESSDPEYPNIPHFTFEEVLEEVCKGKVLKRLGLIGTNIMTAQAYEGILKAAKDAEIIKVDSLLRKMRMFKSQSEIFLLREAARIAVKGFEYALSRVKPGMTEIEVMAECIYGVLSQGAEEPGFKVWCVSGENTNQAIGKSTHRRIKEGEIVQITMGAMVDGYVSSFSRPFSFGRPPSDVLRMLEVGLEAHKLTHNLIRDGVEASYVAKRVHDFIRERGLGDYIVYGPAHGIGMMECEFPFIEATSNYKLRENMTFAVDTFLAAPKFGMRYEDTVVITGDGEESFAELYSEIIAL